MRIFLFATIFLTAIGARAESTSPVMAAGWSQTGKIVELYNFGWTIMVKVDGSFVDQSDGVCTGAGFYALDNSNSHFDTLYSHILMAYASQKPTKFWLNSNCGGQESKYQTISTVRTY